MRDAMRVESTCATSRQISEKMAVVVELASSFLDVFLALRSSPVVMRSEAVKGSCGVECLVLEGPDSGLQRVKEGGRHDTLEVAAIVATQELVVQAAPVRCKVR